MEFQHDPVGLAATVRRMNVADDGADAAAPAQSPWSRCGRSVARAFMGAQRWGRIQRREQLAQLRVGLRQALGESDNPVLVHVVPYDIGKLQSGGGRRIAGMARSLSSKFNVFIVSSVWSANSISMTRIAPGCHLVALPVEASFWEQCVRINAVRGAGVFTFPDHFELLREFQAVLDLLSPHARAWGFTSPPAWPVVRRYRRPEQAVFYDAHDDYACFLQNSYGCTDLRLVRRLVDMEREVLAQTTLAVYCTENDRDAARMRCAPAVPPMIVVPNGVDAEACQTVFPGRAWEIGQAIGWKRPIVVFVGAHHQPNLEALDCIVRDLAPAFPGVVFVAAGVNLTAFREHGGIPPGDNVVFAGPVSEGIKEALFSLASVALAPMRSGTGSSLKIPDYVAHGKIVVGTPIGLRDFESLTHFASVIQAEDVGGALGQVLARLARAPAAFDEACRAAREEVQRIWDWSVVARPLVEALRIDGRA